MIKIKDYDVIVVGAGPAGGAAALAAAEKGARTILLEEHPQIGIPHHCSGELYGTESGIGAKILETMDSRVVLSKVKMRRIFSPKGRILEIPLEGKDVYVVDRGLFDMQLAVQAANAGADIMLNTKVTGLLTAEDRVVGVTTSSRTIPELRGKVVIAADGLRALMGGIPIWAGLAKKGKETLSGISWWLANVKDIEPEVLELHLGDFGKKGWIWLHKWDSSTSYVDFESYDDFEKCRSGDWVLSQKIRDAVPVRVTGWAHALPMGKPLTKKVKNGLILAGNAAGYALNLICTLSGRYAGETAAEAVKDGDVTAERLAAYETLCNKIQLGEILDHLFAFSNRSSEDEQELLFDKLAKMDQPNIDVFPF